MEGIVFSIEEFSVFDGPGIRASVFLKGCPLRCMWCHNPEGQRFKPEYIRSPNGCTGCMACMEAGLRSTGTHCLTEESIHACPRGLVRLCGQKYTAKDLVAHLEPKLWMLNTAGGGITFSGGEPLAQPEFLLECLRLLQGKTHRAIQTSGFAPESVFQKVLENCEFMLFDLKHMDPAIHQRYTGVDNVRILNNYRTLAQSGLPFVTRIPLIPGVNDTRQNITATARFMAQLGVDAIELLPYNTAAGAKYKSVGRTYQPDFDPAVPPCPQEDIFREYQIEVKLL